MSSIEKINNSIFDTPEAFFQFIPKEVGPNLEYRKALHTLLEKDTGLQNTFWKLLVADPRIWFDCVCWTPDPRNKPGYRNLPFILRPRQEELILKLHKCVHEGKDFGINKSRSEGATECVTKYMALIAATEKDSYFIVGSRNKDLVDSAGDPYTLMAKIDHAYACSMPWMNLRKDVDIVRTDMKLIIPRTNSVIKGETTNENFSAGRRATAIFLDEFGRVDPTIADSIEGSVHDVCDCVIYGSTHWYGPNHIFNRAIHRETTTLVSLPWYENPTKTEGLYETPDLDEITIKDIEYYRKKCLYVFADINANETFKLSQLERDVSEMPEAIQEQMKSISFVADGGTNLPTGFFIRSPWHDVEERKRGRRDFMSNIWMDPQGSTNAVFPAKILDRIQDIHINPPKYRGEITWNINDRDKVTNGKFEPSSAVKHLEMWCNLIEGRPNQTHNYIIGCDISMGTGASNSTAAVYDCNDGELVGMLATPHMPPHKFADAVTALAQWIHGSSQPFVIYENNGGQGIIFGNRLRWNGGCRIHTGHKEDGKIRTTKNEYGWHSDNTSKSAVLGELSVALTESLRPVSKYKRIRIHDANLLMELRSYNYTDSGVECPDDLLDESSGARGQHGDRVIAAALCILATKDQHKSTDETPFYKPEHCLGRRLEEQRERESSEKFTIRRFLY